MTFPTRLPKPKRSAPDGFTLVELLVVVAIIVLVAFLATPMVRGLFQANNLTAGGNEVVGLLDLARQTAMTQNNPTAVAVVVNAPSDANAAGRAYGLFGFNGEGGAWSQLDRWRYLPNGIVFDVRATVSGMADFSQATANPLVPSLAASPAFRLHGKAIESFNCLVFLPTGQVYDLTDPALLRIIDSQSAASGKTNYFNIIVNQDAGRTKVVRP